MWHYQLVVQIFAITQFCFAQRQANNTYPNPRTTGFNECGLKSKGYVCDPEKQLTEQERYRLNNDLLKLSRQTSTDDNINFCSTKGVDATLFITKQSDENFAEQLLNHWAIDGQCKKSIVFVLSTTDHHLYYAADENCPISSDILDKTIREEQRTLDDGNYTAALTTILTKLGESVQEKHHEKSNEGRNAIGHPHEHDHGKSMSNQQTSGISKISDHSFFIIIAPFALYLLTV